MKKNRIEKDKKTGILFIAAMVVVVVIIVAGIVCYGKLRDLWLEQCVINDFETQVSITSGRMVKADVIAEEFGLKKGANLALINFRKKRSDILEKIPNIKSISVSRTLPDKVAISFEERTPSARVLTKSKKSRYGRVVDSDGVVFIFQNGTDMLPVIREAYDPGTPPGANLKGKALSALMLIEACKEPDFQELGILEVDSSKPDFLVATLGNYSRLKIAWRDMDENTRKSRENLTKQLKYLVNAMRTRVAPDSGIIWNATYIETPERVTANTQEKL
jgi:hypothetical protein